MSDRSALLDRFADAVYGRTPPRPAVPPAAIEEVSWHPWAGGLLGEWRLPLGVGLPDVRVLVVRPLTDAPVPVLLGPNFGGNHTVVADPAVRVHERWLLDYVPGCRDHRATAAARGCSAEAWCADRLVARGWALATVCASEMQEDRPDGDGLLRAWDGAWSARTIAAWAWGLSRIVDWIATCSWADRARLAVAGHSRLGKTALLAAAGDPRIAFAAVSQSGCGGAGPSKDPSPGAETVADITRGFPHWFVPAFAAATVPVEQHELLACVAPRRLILTNASDDAWAGPEGQWRSLCRAAPAWGVHPPAAMPAVGERLRGPLGWWMRTGRHSQTPAEIAVWLDAAEEAFGASA